MTLTQAIPAGKGRCDQCALWKITRPPSEGFCLRNAPRPCGAADGIAHWPTTHGRQGCGEFVEADSKPELPACGDCVFWHRPELGLQPVDRGDKPGSWWAQAGLCVRHAPRPVSEPGPRAFWCATHQGDSCAEGVRATKWDQV
jgi:hypothetical protein